MKKIIFSIILILIFGLLVYNKFNNALIEAGNQQVIITNQNDEDIVVNVELAKTSAQHNQGLSNRKSLDVGNGMLFVFQDKQVRSFWMKNMNFPLDIIWLDGEKIIKISSDLPPAGELPDISYYSEGIVDYVLEVPAGFCDNNNIREGNTVFYNY